MCVVKATHAQTRGLLLATGTLAGRICRHGDVRRACALLRASQGSLQGRQETRVGERTDVCFFWLALRFDCSLISLCDLMLKLYSMLNGSIPIEIVVRFEINVSNLKERKKERMPARPNLLNPQLFSLTINLNCTDKQKSTQIIIIINISTKKN